MAKILCIGSVTKDIFFPTSEGVILDTPEELLSQKKIAFELGAKYHIPRRFETVGGVTANVASGLTRLGEKTSCLAVVGSDETASWIRNELIGQNIDTGNLVQLPSIMSDLSAIIVDSNSGERTIFSSHSASGCLEIDKSKIYGFDWIFVGDLSGSWEKNLTEIISACHERNIPIAFNPRQKNIAENPEAIIDSLKNCRFFVVNKDEALELLSAGENSFTNEELEDENFLLRQLKEKTAGIVAITDGLRGAWATDGEWSLHAEAVAQNAVDTTGAGDAFTSGFFASLIKNYDLATCLRWGIANSSASVTEYGGQAGLLDEEKIKEFAEKVVVA